MEIRKRPPAQNMGRILAGGIADRGFYCVNEPHRA